MPLALADFAHRTCLASSCTGLSMHSSSPPGADLLCIRWWVGHCGYCGTATDAASWRTSGTRKCDSNSLVLSRRAPHVSTAQRVAFYVSTRLAQRAAVRLSSVMRRAAATGKLDQHATAQ